MQNIRPYIPSAIFLLLLVLTYIVIKPFLIAMFIGALLAYMLHPIYQRILKKINYKRLVAVLLTVLIVLVLVIPAIFIVKSLINESYVLYLGVRQQLAVGVLDGCQSGFCAQINGFLEDPSIQYQVQEIAKTSTNWVIQKGSNILLSIPRILLGLFVLLFTFYYCLIDGKKLMLQISDFFSKKQSKYVHVIKRLKEIIHGVVYGYFLIALIQGLLGTLGFLIFGLPSPLFWGVLMTLFALIPVLGPWVIWAPASLFMLIQGISQDSSSLILKAIGLFIYGAIIVSTSDNILRPKLVGDKAKVHPILILIGTIGGLVVFGPIGVIFGPLVLSLTSVIFEVYVKRKSV